jgi:hypothetical protein
VPKKNGMPTVAEIRQSEDTRVALRGLYRYAHGLALSIAPEALLRRLAYFESVLELTPPSERNGLCYRRRVAEFEALQDAAMDRDLM